jgi:hypothetical protein
MNRFTDGLHLPSEDEAIKAYREIYGRDSAQVVCCAPLLLLQVAVGNDWLPDDGGLSPSQQASHGDHALQMTRIDPADDRQNAAARPRRFWWLSTSDGFTRPPHRMLSVLAAVGPHNLHTDSRSDPRRPLALPLPICRHTRG